jgi:CheY-like chemotaxis protein
MRLTGLCQYDRRRFSPEIIRDAIRTHPVVVLRNEVCPNHLYEPPELFLNGHSTDKRVEWMMSRLKGEKRAATSTATVMVVDDDQFLRSQMKQSVEKMGYRAVKAEDEQEMIETARRERPDLVLTNTDLGWLDRLIALLRRDEELRFLPVAAVYPDPPENFQDVRLMVLDGYEKLESILPPAAPQR